MNTLLLALQLLVADTSAYPFPSVLKPKMEHPNWESIEASVSKKYQDSVIEALRIGFYADYFAVMQPEPQEFKSSFRFVHLNNDKLPDVIYKGPSGGEGDMVQIFIHRGWRMEKVFVDMQSITQLEFTNRQLSGVVIYDPGCCAETVTTERHFQVDPQFRFRLTGQRAVLSDMETYYGFEEDPLRLFSKPIHFKTANADYAMRYSPEISDQRPAIFSLDEPARGNIIAIFPKGAHGIAWGYKKDKTGREWWLVEMDPLNNLSFHKFWHYEKEPTRYCGWMSSRFLERTP
jgi:hypothetical protein